MSGSLLSFTRLRAQFVKEILSILRDPRSRMVVFVPPILQLLVFAFAATLEVRNVDIAVYNQDAGRWSHELVQRLDSARFITHVRHVDSQRQLHELIDRGEIIAALTIPVDFSRTIAAGGSGRAQVLVDGRRSNSGQITVAYLSTIAAEVGASVVPGAQTPNPVVVRHWFNPNLVYRWFIVPGLTGILALFSALLITSLSIARERELGTFDQLLVSPTSTPEIIISKSLPALAIGTLLGLFMISAGVFLFGIPFTGSFALLLASLMLFILSVVGMAYVQELLPGRAGVASALFGNTMSAGFLLSGLGTGLFAQAFGYWSIFGVCALLCVLGGAVLFVPTRQRAAA